MNKVCLQSDDDNINDEDDCILMMTLIDSDDDTDIVPNYTNHIKVSNARPVRSGRFGSSC